MAAWRYRRCPSCDATFPAGEFRPLRYGAKSGSGWSKRRCPRCSHVASTREFRVVADLRWASN